jgi:DNA-binding NarL/FixJ family response regulator
MMRVLLVDDHPLVRAGARRLIVDRWPDADVVEAGTLAEALAALNGCTLAVLDLSLPDASGLEALVKLRRRAPAVPLLVLSMHAEEAYAARALQLGASGYLPKDRASEELVTAVQRLLSGGRYIGADLADRLADLLTGASPAQPAHATPVDAGTARRAAAGAGTQRRRYRRHHVSVGENRQHLPRAGTGEARPRQQRRADALLPCAGLNRTVGRRLAAAYPSAHLPLANLRE